MHQTSSLGLLGWYLALLIALFFLSACTDTRLRVDEAVLVLRDVTVFDATGKPPMPNQTVVIHNDQIVALGATDDFVFGDSATVLDLSGHYVLPGFIDMHAHVTILPFENGVLAPHYDPAASEHVLQTLLAFGITTVRNPAAPTADGIALRDAVAQDLVQGPRILTAGAALDRVQRPFGPFVAAPTEAAIREAVRLQVAAGVDFIKVYGALAPPLVEAAIDEAHKHGVPVIGHMQRTTWTQAARFGIDAITHGAPWSPEYLPEPLRAAYRPTLKGRIDWLNQVDFDGPEIDSMLAAMAEHGVTVDPTLIAYHTKFWGNDSRYLAHPEQHLAPAMIRDLWQQASFTSDWTADDYRRAQAAWPKVLGLTKRLFDRGILLTAGSDLPNPWVIPGVSFHEELQLLADAGIPLPEVLRIATINGATALGLDDEIGTVETGKRADLVVLTANPLEDIRNTRALAWILNGGTLMKPETLLPGR